MEQENPELTEREQELAEEVLAAKESLRKFKRQLVMVMDLNKCIGCQTCTMGCKSLWTRKKGREYMWWNTVNTLPGKGTPKDWERTGGGGYKVLFDGKVRDPVLGRLPTRKELGDNWKFNFDEVIHGDRENAHLKATNPDGTEPPLGVSVVPIGRVGRTGIDTIPSCDRGHSARAITVVSS